MKKNRNLFICLIALMTIAAVLPAYAQAAAAPKVLRWSYAMPPKSTYAFGWEWLGPEFEKRTEGRYKVEFYPAEILFKTPSAYDSIQAGVAQVTHINVGSFGSRLPLSNVALLPTLSFPGGVKGVMAGNRALLEMYNKFPQLQAEYKGLKLFGFHYMDSSILVSKKKEVTLPEHFKGMKVGGSGYKTELVSNAGGADVLQIPPDAYMNMDKGVVDASFLSYAQIGLFKIFETAKYYYDYPFGAGAFAMVMNQDFWNGMSPSDQKIFMELWDKALEMGTTNSAADTEKGRKAVNENPRLTVKKATPQEDAAWKKAAAPILANWVKMAKKTGAKDPEAVLAEWKRLTENYKE